MARNRREQSDPRVINDWIKEGRGKGRNGSYQPWLRIQDVAGHGIQDRIPGRITGDRLVHTLSGHETYAFFIFEWWPSVVDIREQYPLLPLEETLDIALKLGVDHPAEPKTGRPIVMSTDLFVTTKDEGPEKNLAVPIKEVKDLSSKNVRGKLEIERCYHEIHGAKFGILTERDIPLGLAMNLEDLREKRDLERFRGVCFETIARVEKVLLPILWKQELTLSIAAAHCDKQLGVEPGTSLTVAFHLLYLRKWTADLLQPWQRPQPFVLLTPQPKEAHDALIRLPGAVA
jgi:hypothetical protein